LRREKYHIKNKGLNLGVAEFTTARGKW
jgi:hypothetical protein